jgi:hypothetical protein
MSAGRMAGDAAVRSATTILKSTGPVRSNCQYLWIKHLWSPTKWHHSHEAAIVGKRCRGVVGLVPAIRRQLGRSTESAAHHASDPSADVGGAHRIGECVRAQVGTSKGCGARYTEVVRLWAALAHKHKPPIGAEGDGTMIRPARLIGLVP